MDVWTNRTVDLGDFQHLWKREGLLDKTVSGGDLLLLLLGEGWSGIGDAGGMDV